jgi:hypothetical protein
MFTKQTNEGSLNSVLVDDLFAQIKVCAMPGCSGENKTATYYLGQRQARQKRKPTEKLDFRAVQKLMGTQNIERKKPKKEHVTFL